MHACVLTPVPGWRWEGRRRTAAGWRCVCVWVGDALCWICSSRVPHLTLALLHPTLAALTWKSDARSWNPSSLRLTTLRNRLTCVKGVCESTIEQPLQPASPWIAPASRQHLGGRQKGELVLRAVGQHRHHPGPGPSADPAAPSKAWLGCAAAGECCLLGGHPAGVVLHQRWHGDPACTGLIWMQMEWQVVQGCLAAKMEADHCAQTHHSLLLYPPLSLLLYPPRKRTREQRRKRDESAHFMNLTDA